MAARLVFLSGSKAGTTLDLTDAAVTIGRKADRTVVYSTDDVLVSTEHASVRYRDGRYVLRDDGSRNGTFVNSQRVTERPLEHGDLIQLGPGGPTVRFVQETKPGMAVTVDVAAQAERRAAELAAMASGTAPVLTTRDLVAVTYYRLTQRIRGWVLVAAGVILLAVVGLVIWQRGDRSRLERQLSTLAADVARSRGGLSEEMAALEARYAALRDLVASGGRGPRVPGLSVNAVSEFTRGVGMITVTYGFSRAGKQDLLRYELDSQGQVATTTSRSGESVPKVSFTGSGAPVQRTATATGFLVDSTGYLLTSRYITEPWVSDSELQRLRSGGVDLDGRIIEAHVYFPPGDRSLPIVVQRRSDSADVAVVRAVGKPGVPFLALAADTSLMRPGDGLILIGYPADARGLLFRVDSTERNDILRRAGSGGGLTAELARRGLIQPLVSDGAITTTTSEGITHTAGAAFGGGGAPLINGHRHVVGVQRTGTSGAQQAARIRYAWEVLPAHIQRAIGAPK
jgi:S1-C subfamily serine protease